MIERLESIGAPLSLIAAGLLLACIAMVVPAFERTILEAMIYAIIIMGLGVFIGNTGIVSFGHISFALVGAYAAAWQTCCVGMRHVFLPGLPEWLATLNAPLPVAMIGAVLISGALAILVGAILLRLNGVAASIGFLSFLFMLKTIYENWSAWTTGQSSLVGLPLVVTPMVVLFWLSIVVTAAFAYQVSSRALLVRAARDDEPAARASGVQIWRERLAAFVLSAMLVAIGGVLYAHYLGSISVSLFWLDMTFLTLAMLVIGGRQSLTGACVGALAVVGVRDLLRTLERGGDGSRVQLSLPEGAQEITLAVILLIVLIFRPQGLMGRYELNLPKVLRHAYPRKV